jgi:alpha-glucosidase
MHWTAAIHHDGSEVYLSNPQPKLREVVKVRLRTPKNAPITRVFLRTAPDGENHLEEMKVVEENDLICLWETNLPIIMPYTAYHFKVLSSEGAYFYTAMGTSRATSPDAWDFKILANFDGPDWIHDTVFYQIFPDRFHNGDHSLDPAPGAWSVGQHTVQMREWGAPPLPWRDAGNLDFYGGDLPGIAQKLDYLGELGVNALYLTPIFTSTSNHRYDVSDFEHIDPHVGGNDGLAALRRALDQHNMRIVLDITLNHCGWFNPWFVKAQADPHTPSAEYFTFYDHPNKYESWLGVRSLPKLNYRSQKLRDVLFNNEDALLKRWLREPYRIDGWRLDVANMQARQGEWQLQHKIGRMIRRSVKSVSEDAYILGEHFYDGTPHLQGNELDAAMNYSGFTMPFWKWLSGYDHRIEWHQESADRSVLPAEALTEQWERFLAAVPWAIARQQFNLLDSHDTTRILRIIGGDKDLLRVAVATQIMFPGVPCIYYGTEIGMEGGKDPDNRRCMVWDERQQDRDLFAYYQNLIRIRRTAPALIRGGYQLLFADGGTFAFQRQSTEQRLILIAAREKTASEVQIPVQHGAVHDGASFRDLIGGGTFTVSGGVLSVPSFSRPTALILEEVR